MLDFGGFVRSPEAPADPQLDEFLRTFDELMATWRRMEAKCRELPFSAAWRQRKQMADCLVSEYAAPWRAQYALRAVERDPNFLPVGRYLARPRPLTRPFSVLDCSAEIPLHTVQPFREPFELSDLNAALNEQAALRWWQDGPRGHPCYLYGLCLWELKPSELTASERGVTLLLEALRDKSREKRDRLTAGLAGLGGE
jgi:hypothetical protein